MTAVFSNKNRWKKQTLKHNGATPASITLACTGIYRAGPQVLYMHSLTSCTWDSTSERFKGAKKKHMQCEGAGWIS